LPGLCCRVSDHDGRCTKAFIDMMLAWGLARLGERQTAQRLAADASANLDHIPDHVLRFLGRAFHIASNGRSRAWPPGGPLPPAMLAELDRIDRAPGGDRIVLSYRIQCSARHLAHPRAQSARQSVSCLDGARPGFANACRRDRERRSRSNSHGRPTCPEAQRQLEIALAAHAVDLHERS